MNKDNNQKVSISNPPKYSRLLATGSALPEKVMSNQDFEKIVDTTAEWIMSRVGIETRYIANQQETPAMLASLASQRAIDMAGINVNSIDMIIVASCSNDKAFPSVACYVQEKLGITRHCAAFDISAACSGFIYALSIGDQFIRSGSAKRILIVGSENISRFIDWQDRSTCVLFGDGAGAAIIEVSDKPGVYSTHLHADGSHTGDLFAQQNGHVQMKGNAIFKYAVNHMGAIVEEALQANQLTHQQIDWFVPHQANLRIIQAMANKLDLSMDKVVVTVDQHGNTSAASVPLALDTAIRDGRIQRGDNVLLEAFGGGLTWASALINY